MPSWIELGCVTVGEGRSWFKGRRDGSGGSGLQRRRVSFVRGSFRGAIATVLWLPVLVALGVVVGPAAAQAQSLFQTLFGFGSAKPAPQVKRSPAASGPARGKVQPSQSFSRWSRDNGYPSHADHNGAHRGSGFGGSYRTVCVRLCDGYYWPLSRSVSRDRFAEDARRCQSSCAGEAKLFYQHRSATDPASLIDLEGRSYDKLKNAFLYRRTLVNGCGCRPAPWSIAETYRHRQYAAADAARQFDAIARLLATGESEPAAQTQLAQADGEASELENRDGAEGPADGQALAQIQAQIQAGDTAAVPSVTGYVHLHVLPGADFASLVQDVEPGNIPAAAGMTASSQQLAAIEGNSGGFYEPSTVRSAAFRRGAANQSGVRTGLTSSGSASRAQDAKPQRRNKPPRTAAVQKSPAPAATFVWPGDQPKRIR